MFPSVPVHSAEKYAPCNKTVCLRSPFESLKRITIQFRNTDLNIINSLRITFIFTNIYFKIQHSSLIKTEANFFPTCKFLRSF